MVAAPKYEGTPCPVGHTLRYKSNDQCVECKKSYRAEHYKTNKARINAQNTEFYSANKASLSGARKRWSENNKDKRRVSALRLSKTAKAKATRAKYLERTKADRKAKSDAYYSTNREKIAVRRAKCYDPKKLVAYRAKRKTQPGYSARVITMFKRRRARKHGAEGFHTYKEILALLKSQNYKCVTCPVKLNKKRHADHIIPLSRGGSDFISNIQMLCPSCNLSKGNKTMQEWLAHKARFICKEAA